MPYQIENRMVEEHGAVPEEHEEFFHGLSGPGWREIGTGKFVSDEDAFDYALEQCFEIVPEFVRRIRWRQDFKDMLVEWFYSGGWTYENDT